MDKKTWLYTVWRTGCERWSSSKNTLWRIGVRQIDSKDLSTVLRGETLKYRLVDLWYRPQEQLTRIYLTVEELCLNFPASRLSIWERKKIYHLVFFNLVFLCFQCRRRLINCFFELIELIVYAVNLWCQCLRVVRQSRREAVNLYQNSVHRLNSYH